MNFIFHTLKLRNRERNAKKNSTVKDASDAVEKNNPKKFGRLAADSTLTFSIILLLYYWCSLLHLQPLLVSSRSAPPHTRLLRRKPHSFPTVSQLEFSFHFLEGVRTISTVQ